jgi:predicted dehydrogenase
MPGLTFPRWEHSFIDCTRHFIDALQKGGEPILDGATGKSVLQFTLAALQSSKTGREVRPEEVE